VTRPRLFFEGAAMDRISRRWTRAMFPRPLVPARLWMWWVLPFLASVAALHFATRTSRPAFPGVAARVEAGASRADLVTRLVGAPRPDGLTGWVEVRLVERGKATVLRVRLEPVDEAGAVSRLGHARVAELAAASGARGAWFVGACADLGECSALPDGSFAVMVLGAPHRPLDFLGRS
jgi:hypothetical protein